MSNVATESAATAPRPDESHTTHVLARVRDALHQLRYGEVVVKVQDGVVVQVERTERVRMK